MSLFLKSFAICFKRGGQFFLAPQIVVNVNGRVK